MFSMAPISAFHSRFFANFPMLILGDVEEATAEIYKKNSVQIEERDSSIQMIDKKRR